MAGYLQGSPETATTLLIDYTPVQNKNLKFGGGNRVTCTQNLAGFHHQQRELKEELRSNFGQ